MFIIIREYMHLCVWARNWYLLTIVCNDKAPLRPRSGLSPSPLSLHPVMLYPDMPTTPKNYRYESEHAGQHSLLQTRTVFFQKTSLGLVLENLSNMTPPPHTIISYDYLHDGIQA